MAVVGEVPMRPMAPHVAQRLAEIREAVENDGGTVVVASICQNTGSALVVLLSDDDDEEPMALVIDSSKSFDQPMGLLN